MNTVNVTCSTAHTAMQSICSGRGLDPGTHDTVAPRGVPSDLPGRLSAHAATAAPDVATPTRPEIADDEQIGAGPGGYIVVVYDNDYNTVDEVIRILQHATACSLEEASIETWEIHNLGKSVVHHGSQPECDRAASIIRTIGIRVEVVEE